MPQFDPSSDLTHDIELGQVYSDSRTGDLIQLVYLDRNVYVMRDEDSGRHRFGSKKEFVKNVKNDRYKYEPDEEPFTRTGVMNRVKERLSAYESQDGRKANHLAQGMREALDILLDLDLGDEDKPIPFEDLSNIGEKAAGNLRDAGYETCADVMVVDDDELLDVSWVGEKGVQSIRSYCV